MFRRLSALPLLERIRTTRSGVLAALCMLFSLPIRATALSGGCFGKSQIEVSAESLDAGAFQVHKWALERLLGAPPLAGLDQRLQARGFSLGIGAAVVVRAGAEKVGLLPIESEKRASLFGAALDAGEEVHAFLVLPMTKRRAPFLLEAGVDLGRSRVARVSLGSLDGRVKTLHSRDGSIAEGRFESLVAEDYPQAAPECTWCVVNECLLDGDWCSWAMTLVVNCWDCWTGAECTDCFVAIAQSVSCYLIDCDACYEECRDLLPPPFSFVFVPSGTFTMGDGKSTCGINERQVTLTHDFWIGQYEVTNQEYLDLLQWAYDRGYVTATSASVQDNLDGSTEALVDLDSPDCEIAFADGVFTSRDAGRGGTNPGHPVKEVTWYGAAAYCDWLSLAEGLPRAYDHSNWVCGPGGNPYAATGYRLPTDAEWEYAARWDDERIYPWGNENPACSLANYFWEDGFCVGWTAPAGSYPSGVQPNFAAPIYDLAGNVSEWCNDWWICSLGYSPETDPQGPESSYYRVVRGGSYAAYVSSTRNCLRSKQYPNISAAGAGFRAVRSD